MNWVHSAAVRAGRGAPEWLVIAIILALIFAAGCERGGGDQHVEALAVSLSRRDKIMVAVFIAVIVSLTAFAVYR